MQGMKQKISPKQTTDFSNALRKRQEIIQNAANYRAHGVSNTTPSRTNYCTQPSTTGYTFSSSSMPSVPPLVAASTHLPGCQMAKIRTATTMGANSRTPKKTSWLLR